MSVSEANTRSPTAISLPPFSESPMRQRVTKKFPNPTANKTATFFFKKLLAYGVEDTQADISWTVRLTMDNPIASDSIPQQLMGVTTGVNAFQGWVAYKLAQERFDKAAQSEDTAGKIESGIDQFRGVTQGIGGAAYLAFRGTQTALYVQTALGHTHAASTVKLAIAGKFLGNVGGSFFSAFFAAIGVWGAFKLHKDIQFKKKYEAAKKEGDVPLFEFLAKHALIDSRKECAKLKESSIFKTTKQKKAFREKIRNTALDYLIAENSLMQRKDSKLEREMRRKNLEKEFDCEELKNHPHYKELLFSLGLTEKDMEGLDYSLLELLGFSIEEQRRQERKDVKLARLTDAGCVEAIKKAAARGLAERLESKDPLTREVASLELRSIKVEQATEKNRFFNKLFVVIGFIGAISMLIGMLPFAWAPMAAFVIVLLPLVLMFYADAKFANDNLNAVGPIGKFDKKYVIAVGVIALVSLILSGGITGALVGLGYLTMAHLLPLIPAALIGLAGMGLSVYGYRKLNEKEEKYRAAHPNLETVTTLFQNALEDFLTEQQEASFKKLPKIDRLAVRKAFQSQLEDYDIGKHCPIESFPTKWTSEEKRLMIKAVKKSWKFYALDRVPESKPIAHLMRSLLDTMLSPSEENDKKFTEAFKKLEYNEAVFEHFQQDVVYVFARQRLVSEFTRALQSASDAKRRREEEDIFRKETLQEEIPRLKEEIESAQQDPTRVFFYQELNQRLKAKQAELEALESSASQEV